ncbi:MAG TPA: hypothetical protein VFV50_09040 [Bdellovibrionales bacterium]|nr:hypothetical protein [Bdellovibrionales bacterium]
MRISFFIALLFIWGPASARPHPPVAIELGLGFSHSCARFADGNVKCWGDGHDGQHGHESPEVLGDAPNEVGVALADVNFGGRSNTASLASGGMSTCALLEDGALKCWGFNRYGELAIGTSGTVGNAPNQMGNFLRPARLGASEAIRQVSAGSFYACALFESRRVKCWGQNNAGKLGYGDDADRGNTPETLDDKIPFVDLGDESTPVKIAVGANHTCALFENGRMKCWGYGGTGELGYGDRAARGDDPGEMGNNLPFVNLGTNERVVQVSIGYSFTCALLESRRVKCWGLNEVGQLGLGDTKTRGDDPDEMGDRLPFVDLGTGMIAIGIASGGSHTCAKLLNGTLKCWGFNRSGQLGYDDTVNRGDDPGEMGDLLEPVYLGRNVRAESFELGSSHTCAVLHSMGQYRGVKCWGENSLGQLGLGHSTNMGDKVGDMRELPFIEFGN